ncbi:MAG: ribonuclease HI [Janthinobacterium lividum]
MVKLTLVGPHAQTESTSQFISLYTDGACSGNPGPGGWGVFIRSPSGQETELSGSELMTTNNRMELMAAIKGLESLSASQEVAIYTDSMYLRDGMTKWIIKWKTNDWLDATQRNIKNLDLWRRLDQLAQEYKIHWHWVRGHSGHAENERADLLARNAIVQLMMQECS